MDVNLRLATYDDSALLYLWRIEGETADWYEGPHTSRRQHDEWLWRRIGNPCVTIWIVEADNAPVGVVRLDSNDELSVEIAPEHRGEGYGVEAIQAACAQAKGRVKACVDATNERARTAFLKAGFAQRDDVIFYLWRPA
jgi:RimJ/RimL family protein N-acetyltransferase